MYQPMRSKPKPISPCTRDFFNKLHQAIARNSDWFISLFVLMLWLVGEITSLHVNESISFYYISLQPSTKLQGYWSNVDTNRAWFACDPLSWTSLYCTRFVWYRLRFFTVRLLHFYFYSMGLVGAKNFPWPFPWFIAVVTALCAFRPLAGLPPGRKYSTINLCMISFASL